MGLIPKKMVGRLMHKKWGKSSVNLREKRGEVSATSENSLKPKETALNQQKQGR